MVARHFLETNEVRLNLGDSIDRALKVVFVTAIYAVLDVEGHYLQHSWALRSHFVRDNK
jgi:hypothetical protein